MSEKAYLDFDLRVRRVDGAFSARVLNSPAGEAKVEFNLPFSELEMENFLLRVGRPRRGVRRMESPEMEAARIIGGRLFEAIFDDEVRSCFRRSLDTADRRNLGLRIRLRLDAPELADIPWEYLYDTTHDRFLSLSRETPIVRYLDLPERIRPLSVKPPLRMLAMISSPDDFPPLDVEREWSKLTEAIGDLEGQGLLELERLEEATLSALQRQLRRGEYHIFHFIGHGAFDERSQDGVLLLESENGRGRPVSGRDLGTILHDHRSLRLALLNACEGASTARSDPFAGVAHSLVQQRIPAVIAMQFEITDEAAITLAHGFYAALVDGYPVDAALAEARKAIFARENDVEWGKPVLYLRAADGRVFDVDRLSDAERKERQIAALLLEAQGAMAAQEWKTAMEKFQAILALDPAHAEAVSKLRKIQEQQKLSVLYARGLKHYQVGRWREASEYLGQVQGIDAGYRDVSTLLAAAARQMVRDQARPEPEPTPVKDNRWLWAAIPVALLLLAAACGGGYFIITGISTPTPTPTNVAVESTTVTVPVTETFEPTPTSTPPTPTLTPTLAPTPITPTPTSTPSYIQITLPEEDLYPSKHSMKKEGFANPLQGIQTFNGVPFKFENEGAFIQTQFLMEGEHYGRSMPQEVRILVPTKASKVHKVYVLMNLSYGCAAWAPYGSRVGEIEFAFDDGSSKTEPLQTGHNIREWSVGATTHCTRWTGSSKIIDSVEDEANVRQVWKGYRMNSNVITVIDMHVVEIPYEHREQQLVEIVIRDTSLSKNGYLNPAIIVFAITVLAQ